MLSLHPGLGYVSVQPLPAGLYRNRCRELSHRCRRSCSKRFSSLEESRARPAVFQTTNRTGTVLKAMAVLTVFSPRTSASLQSTAQVPPKMHMQHAQNRREKDIEKKDRTDKLKENETQHCYNVLPIGIGRIRIIFPNQTKLGSYLSARSLLFLCLSFLGV